MPLIIRWPAGAESNQLVRIGGMIELVDLAPTLLDAAGLEIPGRMQGKSLLPMLKGEDEKGMSTSRFLQNTTTPGRMVMPMGRCCVRS